MLQEIIHTVQLIGPIMSEGASNQISLYYILFVWPFIYFLNYLFITTDLSKTGFHHKAQGCLSNLVLMSPCFYCSVLTDSFLFYCFFIFIVIWEVHCKTGVKLLFYVMQSAHVLTVFWY